LPQPEGVQLIQDHTNKSYITSVPSPATGEKKRAKAVDKLLKHFDYTVRNIPFEHGHICLRKGKVEADWIVTLFGNAQALF